MKNRRDQVRKTPIVIVPAGESEPNPHNPCARLTPAERQAALVCVLARVYHRLPEPHVETRKRLAA